MKIVKKWKWATKDIHGNIWLYSKKPFLAKEGEFSFWEATAPYAKTLLAPNLIFEIDGDYKDSLYKLHRTGWTKASK